MKIRTTWNLGLMYKSPKDPQIEYDMQQIEKEIAIFAKKWKQNISYTHDLKKLKQALKEYKNLEEIIGDVKPLAYYLLARDIDSQNTFLTAQIAKLQERVTKASNQIIFFTLELGKITKVLQDEVFVDGSFSEYHYLLQKIWREAKYSLGEKEEKILSLKSSPASLLWTDMTEKKISEQTILWKGKKIPVHEASGMIPTLPKKEREKLHGLVIECMKSISFLAEAELNAVCLNKKIDDELRGFSHPYSATILDYENDEQVIMRLMELIKKAYPISHRFYTLKASIMGLQKLHPADTSVTLSGTKQVFTFEQAVEIITKAFGRVDQNYADIFTRFLENGQIDVYPRVGKRGGGYCWGGYNRPTYILLNWTNDLHSVMTLAHEMGHAIHRELSKKQSVLYENHPISTAEVASTLFENFAFQEIVEHLSVRNKLYAQFNRVQDDIATIFRQGAFFSYEQDMHASIRKEGHISSDQFAELMRKNLQAQLGRMFDLKTDDGYLFVRYMHSRWFFYVYSYAYGQLISTALYTLYQKDPSFVSLINQFLSSGGSASPETIFKNIGIDTSKEEFWKIGLGAIDAEIKKLKKLFIAENLIQ